MVRIIMEPLFVAKIERLINRRNKAMLKGNYDKAWKLDLLIDRNRNRLVTCTYCTI